MYKFFSAFLCFFLLAVAVFESLTVDPGNPKFEGLFGSILTLNGTIRDEADLKRLVAQYTVETELGNILISIPLYPRLHSGDAVQVSGKLTKPEKIEVFDYPAYLSLSGVYGIMEYPKISLQKASEAFHPLSDLKAFVSGHLARVFPTDPAHAIIAGLLLGSRESFPQQTKTDLQHAGLSHIIAISGYNITLILSLLMAIFSPLGKKKAALVSALGIIFFTAFVGAGPSVVRACIMGLIGLLGLLTDRPRNAITALLFAGSLMILWNPKILLLDLGFQLSFLATFGLIVLSPLLSSSFSWLPKTLGIRESFILSISAQIMTLPIILSNFGILSLAAPLSNLLISGPVIPLTMLFSFAAILIDIASFTLAKLMAFPAYLLGKYILSVAHFTASLPLGIISVPWFSKSLLILSYLLLGLLIAKAWSALLKREERIQRTCLSFEQRILSALH